MFCIKYQAIDSCGEFSTYGEFSSKDLALSWLSSSYNAEWIGEWLSYVIVEL